MMTRFFLTLLAAAFTLALLPFANAAGTLPSPSFPPGWINSTGVPELFMVNYGAKFDGLTYTDGLATASSTTFTSASATFTSADCLRGGGSGCTGTSNKVINIDFAGPACGPLDTTI